MELIRSTKRTRDMSRYVYYGLLLALSAIVYTPVMMRASQETRDFGAHISVALKLPEKATHVSHVLFPAIFKGYKALFPGAENTDIALTAVLTVLLPLPLIVFHLLSKAAEGRLRPLLLVCLSLGITIAAPITLWTNETMIGYINPIVYHSPTLITVRLLVIPLSLLVCRAFSDEGFRSPNRRICVVLLTCTLTLLSTLAKQSYTMALIPGCCAFAIWRVTRNRPVDWVLLAFGVIIPGVLMLGLQYLVTFVNYSDGSAISFGFFKFMTYYFPVWRIPIQFVLSIVFPVTVYVAYFEKARQHNYLNMSWSVFGIAVFALYFIHESGKRLYHGNFAWLSYSAVFVLIFASLQFLIEQYVRELRSGISGDYGLPLRLSPRMLFCALAFGLHVLSGIAYYLRFTATYTG